MSKPSTSIQAANGGVSDAEIDELVTNLLIEWNTANRQLYKRGLSTHVETKKKATVMIKQLLHSQLALYRQELVGKLPEKLNEEFIHVSHFVHDKECIPDLTHNAQNIGFNQALTEVKQLIERGGE